MTTRKPLPTISPCLCGKSHLQPHVVTGATCFVWSPCGWQGPSRYTARGAILAWNRRAPDDDAANLWNQWSLLAGSWMRPRFGTHATANFLQAMSRDRGEVLPEKGKRA